MDLPLNELSDFRDHPFKVANDEGFKNLMESIKDFGVLSPAIARPKLTGGYELISGHRRKAACELLGMEKLPVIVRDMTDDQATIIMVDSNIQRENLLPSEKAFAYKIKLEALKRQAGRPSKENVCQVGTKSRSDVELAENSNESARTIQRYIRLTELIPQILQMVDERKIAFNPAVEISFLTIPEQQFLLDAMKREQSTPSLSQAKQMKILSTEKKLTNDEIDHIITEEKGNQKGHCLFGKDTFAKYFPESYTEKQMADVMEKLLSDWNQRQKSRREQER
jgi:ParB family chromosome partitioning protein